MHTPHCSSVCSLKKTTFRSTGLIPNTAKIIFNPKQPVPLVGCCRLLWICLVGKGLSEIAKLHAICVISRSATDPLQCLVTRGEETCKSVKDWWLCPDFPFHGWEKGAVFLLLRQLQDEGLALNWSHLRRCHLQIVAKQMYQDSQLHGSEQSCGGGMWVGTLSQPNLDFWPIWSVLCTGMARTWGILGVT